LRRGSSGTFIPAGGGGDCEGETSAETRAADIRGVNKAIIAVLWRGHPARDVSRLEARSTYQARCLSY